MNETVRKIGELLRKNNLTLGTVESATGGLISSMITDISGSSDYFQGAVVSYSNEIKMNLVGVKKETLDTHGAVSSRVAEEMAQGGRRVLGVDICVADTGIAGPTGATRDKPVGLFYLGLAHRDGVYNRKHVFRGDREQNKLQAAVTVLGWILEYLNEIDRGNVEKSGLEVKQVVTCFLESEGKILLLRRSERVGTYQGRWAGVSGYVESTPDRQALIEIKEETGLDEDDVELRKKGVPLEVIDYKLNTRWIVNPYLFHVRDKRKIVLDWEHRESIWIGPDEIDKYSTVPKLKETLDHVLEIS